MPNYQNGKIYKITSPSTDKIYIGSTVQPLNKRFINHKSCYNRGLNKSSGKIIQYDDCQIELIEEYPCNTKNELEHREQYYMNLYKELLVNSYNSIQKCRKEQNRIYRDNPINKQNARINREKNKAQKSEADAIYRLNNIDKLQAQKKAYYDWERSWGGDRRYNNNPLSISKDLFKESQKSSTTS
jgi:hypothetical protein